MKKTVIVGITSGIAAYKGLEIIRLLKKKDIDVFVTMTDAATQMIVPDEFEKESGNKVLSQLFEKDFDYKKILEKRVVDHIALADKADCMVIAPGTANVIAKLAYGIADDFLTTTALAVTKPIILAPSMNVNMWNNPVVQENLKKLKQRGYIIVEPEEGQLACGYEGIGRLAEPETIVKEIVTQVAYTQSLQGKKVLVTAGGTIENIDNIRYITNRSSGKMGIAIAQECYRRGAQVLLLRAKNAVRPRYLIKEEEFSTATDLLELIKKHVKNYDYIYHAAAVSDFTVENSIKGKLSSTESVTLILKPQIKILDQIKKLNPQSHLIAFKAEYESDEKKLIDAAVKRFHASHADAIVVNDVSKKESGFEVDNNEVFVVSPDGSSKHIPFTSKEEVAKAVVAQITSLPTV